MLRPIILVVTIQSIIWDFKVFTQIYVMTNGGGIAGRNLVLNVYAYQQAFAASEYGLGATIGVVMTVLLLAITMFYLRALRRFGGGPVRRWLTEGFVLVIAAVVAFPLFWMVLSALQAGGRDHLGRPGAVDDAARRWTASRGR